MIKKAIRAVGAAMQVSTRRRAVAAMVLAAAPLVHAIPAAGAQYNAAFYSLNAGYLASLALNVGMELGCIFIPLAPPVCVLLMAA